MNFRPNFARAASLDFLEKKIAKMLCYTNAYAHAGNGMAIWIASFIQILVVELQFILYFDVSCIFRFCESTLFSSLSFQTNTPVGKNNVLGPINVLKILYICVYKKVNMKKSRRRQIFILHQCIRYIAILFNVLTTLRRIVNAQIKCEAFIP